MRPRPALRSSHQPYMKYTLQGVCYVFRLCSSAAFHSLQIFA
jgi:hypothetical protein